ncbi:fused response regulator/phosphatase [Lutibacter sp. B2]|nr:fused response regulator/phosphatase [Lutibacter sp. B2]
MSYSILIADDMFVNRMLMKALLQKKLKDSIYYEAKDGNEALEIVKEREIDLIILDLMMPEKDGYEVLIALKSNPLYKDIPIIVNSALTDIENIEKSLQNGALDYFAKPLSPDEMKIVLPLKVKNALKHYEQKKLIKKLSEKIKDELNNAHLFQNIMMPKSKCLDKIDIYTRYLPSIEIGGDIFDCVILGDDIWFIIADVVGHGIAAAMVSSMVKVLFNDCIKYHNNSPKEVLENMNNIVIDMFDPSDYFNHTAFTAFVGCIRKDKLIYSNAGHPYPIVFEKKEERVQMLTQNGFIVGIFENAKYENKYTKIEKGDAILVYTDGLFSKRKNGVFEDWTSMYNYVSEKFNLIETDPKKFVDNLLCSSDEGNTKDFADDVALMLFKIK